MSTSPHVCLGGSCSPCSVTSLQGMHLTSPALPDEVPQTPGVKQHHRHRRKSPWQEPGMGFVPCRYVRRHRAELAASPAHVPFLKPLPAPPQGSLLGQPCISRAPKPPPHQHCPQSSPEAGDSVTTTYLQRSAGTRVLQRPPGLPSTQS